MAKEGYIKRGHSLQLTPIASIIQDQEKYRYPQFSLQKHLITVGDKVVSYEMLYAMIAKRFHTCLKFES